MHCALLSAALLLAACGRGPDPQPRGLTVDDQAQLNDAAAMLDANAVDLNAVTAVDEPDGAGTPSEGNSDR